MTRHATTQRSAEGPGRDGLSPRIPEMHLWASKGRAPTSAARSSWSRLQGRGWTMEAAPTNWPG